MVLTAAILVAAIGLLENPAWSKSQNLGGLTLLEIAPRIVTPNSDGMNDKIFFVFDTSLTGLPLETAVFDINGAKVGSLQIDSNDIYLTWDGRDGSGRVVPAGIYVYTITLGKSAASGTVIVAR